MRWQGSALGAEASIAIATADREAAGQAIAAARQELAKTERLFSLYRRDSYLSELNRSGELNAPPIAFRELIALSKQISRVSDGAFDITVQPLWRALAKGVPEGPRLEAARALVDWTKLSVEPDRIAYKHAGMAATLNGIAQGYATDRVAAALRNRGFTDVLAHVGEFSGNGLRPDGTPWRIGLASPFDDRIVEVLPLSNGAAATSSPLGTRMGRDGSQSHILDPLSGRSAKGWASVTVTAASAALADGLSTAIAAAPPDRASDILTDGGGWTARLIDHEGRYRELRA